MQKTLDLSVTMNEILKESVDFLSKGKSILFIGQTGYNYARSINMRNGSFNGYAMYAGFKNRTLEKLKKYFLKNYGGITIVSGEGWFKVMSV